jgi:hypothetical protein
VATVQRHERRVEGLACIVAGAAIGSDSEMQRFESFHYPRAQAGGADPSRRSSRRKIGRLARPWRRTGPFAPRGDLGGLPLSPHSPDDALISATVAAIQI